MVVQRIERWTCDQQVVGSQPTPSRLLGAKLRNNIGQVAHTYVPLSPSSITSYRPKGGDALRWEVQKVMAAYRRVDDL